MDRLRGPCELFLRRTEMKGKNKKKKKAKKKFKSIEELRNYGKEVEKYEGT